MFESLQALEYTAVNEVWVITSIIMYKSKMKFESSQALECTAVKWSLSHYKH